MIKRAPVAERPASSFIGLDLLRGFAAVEVFLCHLRGASFVEYGALPSAQHSHVVAALFAATRLGRESVLIFFVLSGYLVFGQVIKRVSESGFDPATSFVLRHSSDHQSWPRESEQGDKWIFCLIAARIAAKQEIS